ncbi:MAG: hypothetical protein ABRQ38_22440 [Candidatus Eremiobacterota bacterium]
MYKKYFLLTVFFTLFLSAGCGDGSSPVLPVYTPTPVPTFATVTPTPRIISFLTETDVKMATISAKDGGTLTEGNMTVDIPPNALANDGKIEIAKVKINNMTSSDVNDGDIYKISSGNEDEVDELQEPAIVRIKADSQQRPLTWNGGEWLPLDYSYDSNTKEIVIELNCLDEDINEWTEEAEEEGSIEEPIIVGIGTSTDYQYSIISSKNRFKIFYCNEQDKSYAQAIGNAIEEAYDYFSGLGYRAPVKSALTSGTSDYIYTYIYPSASSPDYEKTSWGVAGTKGYLAFNKNSLNINENLGKSTCYHEMLHLIQFAYGNRNVYPDWFDESMAVAMQYYGMNKTQEMYDLAGCRWDYDILYSPFNSTSGYYNRYILWSYIIKKQNPAILHNIMVNFQPKDSINRFNTVIQEATGKDFVTTFNEVAEDYYIGGKFFNNTCFNNLKKRSASQPYDYIIARDCIQDPNNSTETISVKPLSIGYRCYESKNFKGSITLDFSEVSTNCRVVIYPIKDNGNGNYNAGNQEVVYGNSSTKTINNFGTDITDIFVLMENTSITSTAGATLKIQTFSAKGGDIPDNSEK